MANDSIEKWAKCIKRQFTGKGIQMALAHVKICLNLFIREKQIKTTHRSDWQKSTNLTTNVLDCKVDGHCYTLLVRM